MEKNGENSIVISVNPKPKPTTDHETVKIPRNRPLEKRNGSKNIFKVALVMMRGRNRKSKVLPEDDESRSVWKKLVGSMRPLHLQSGSPRRHNGLQTPKKMNRRTAPSESGDDGFDSASEYAYSPSATSSRYASAVGLNEMVQDEENQKEEEIIVKELDNGDGDDMIDAKADEFIAQFYQQMKLQRMDTMDRRYREISLRSLGL